MSDAVAETAVLRPRPKRRPHHRGPRARGSQFDSIKPGETVVLPYAKAMSACLYFWKYGFQAKRKRRPDGMYDLTRIR